MPVGNEGWGATKDDITINVLDESPMPVGNEGWGAVFQI